MYTSGAVLWRIVKQTLALFCAFVSGYDIGISSKLFFKSHLLDYNPRVEVCVTSRRRRHHRVHNIYSEAASGHIVMLVRLIVLLRDLRAWTRIKAK